MINKKILSALSVITYRFEGQNINWVLVGSSSLALQNVKVNPHDIDIMTNKKGAEKINILLKEFEIKPIVFGKTERFESHLGEFNIYGVKVEVMGELKEKIKNRWISLENRLKDNKIIEVKGLKIPVSLLDEQLESYSSSERKKDFVRTRKIKELINEKYLHNHQTNIQTFIL